MVGREPAAHHANRVQEGKPIRILVRLEGGFVHQPPDGEVRQQEPEELLPDQIRGLAAQDDPGATKMGLQFHTVGAPLAPLSGGMGVGRVLICPGSRRVSAAACQFHEELLVACSPGWQQVVGVLPSSTLLAVGIDLSKFKDLWADLVALKEATTEGVTHKHYDSLLDEVRKENQRLATMSLSTEEWRLREALFAVEDAYFDAEDFFRLSVQYPNTSRALISPDMAAKYGLQGSQHTEAGIDLVEVQADCYKVIWRWASERLDALAPDFVP